VAGADHIVRETFHSALNLGEQALESLGLSSKDAQTAASLFKQYDEKNVLAMGSFHEDEKKYRSQAQENYDALVAVLQSDVSDAEPLNEATQASQ